MSVELCFISVLCPANCILYFLNNGSKPQIKVISLKQRNNICAIQTLEAFPQAIKSKLSSYGDICLLYNNSCLLKLASSISICPPHCKKYSALMLTLSPLPAENLFEVNVSNSGLGAHRKTFPTSTDSFSAMCRRVLEKVRCIHELT